MIQLIFNQCNFDQPWASDTLMEVFHKTDRVTIFTLESFFDNEYVGMSYLGHEVEMNYDRLKRPFLSYGMKESNIQIIPLSNESDMGMRYRIENSEVLMFVGDHPKVIHQVLEDLDLLYDVLQFQGVLIGIGDCAHAFLDEFEYGESHEMHLGLGLLSGCALLMHYAQWESQLRYLIHLLETREDAVVILPDQGGFLMEDEQIELLGNAFIATDEDLDELYQLVEG